MSNRPGCGIGQDILFLRFEETFRALSFVTDEEVNDDDDIAPYETVLSRTIGP